ncbi:zinc finger protein 568-like [Coccinella septempunctata]|uniref:zinc finger protein 568-like n=1 Tax=Coccinella septempunctata TaxID=41139 RepID=UPI001D06F891|nr:zinc finger protein 568-like [Coccinella septempunctata]
METYVFSLDLNKVCRICLCEDNQMFSIFSEIYEDDNSSEELPCLNEIISSLSSMKIHANDGLPDSICSKCIESAHTSYKFQKCCNRSQLILETYISQCGILKETSIEDVPSIKNKETEEFPTITTDILKESKTPLLYNENDLDLAENYIKESLIEEANNSTIIVENESSLNPDQFFATDDDLTVEPAKDDVKEDGKSVEKPEETSDEEGIGNLKNYEKTLPTGEKFFACKMCERIYKNGSSLRAHIRGHHKKKRPYKCDICGKGFKMYGSFFYHKRMHTGDQPHCCKICGKKYKQSGSLTAHMRIHTGQRPFLCSICGRGFRQQPDLNYHMRTHTKEKPYQCTVCGKTMTMQSHLVQHMRIHTGERPFKCSQCGKAFLSSTCLKRHEIIHTGQKPYTCEVCNKSFNRSSSLNIHSKTHTDDRPHVCPVCDKGFIQAHTLKTHLSTHLSEIKKAKIIVHEG